MRNWDTDIEYMKSDYIAGKSLEDIGILYGVTRERVRQLFVKYGFEYRRSKVEAAEKLRINIHEVNGYNIDDVYKIYQRGATLAYIANELNVSAMTIWKRFKDNGFKMRPSGVRKPP